MEAVYVETVSKLKKIKVLKFDIFNLYYVTQALLDSGDHRPHTAVLVDLFQFIDSLDLSGPGSLSKRERLAGVRVSAVR